MALDIVTRGIQIVTEYLIFGPIAEPVSEPCQVLFLWNSDQAYTARIEIAVNSTGVVGNTDDYDWVKIPFQACGHLNSYTGECECIEELDLVPLGHAVIMFKPSEAYWGIRVIPQGADAPTVLPSGVFINKVSFDKGDPAVVD